MLGLTKGPEGESCAASIEMRKPKHETATCHELLKVLKGEDRGQELPCHLDPDMCLLGSLPSMQKQAEERRGNSWFSRKVPPAGAPDGEMRLKKGPAVISSQGYLDEVSGVLFIYNHPYASTRTGRGQQYDCSVFGMRPSICAMAVINGIAPLEACCNRRGGPPSAFR